MFPCNQDVADTTLQLHNVGAPLEGLELWRIVINYEIVRRSYADEKNTFRSDGGEARDSESNLVKD